MTKTPHTQVRDLAGALNRRTKQVAAQGSSGVPARRAVVGAVGADGTVTTTDGIVALRSSGYGMPAVGDVVVMTSSAVGSWVAVGALAGPDPGPGGVLFKRKTSDTSRASTTAASDDPHLTFTVAAGAVYTIEGYMLFLAGATGDIRIGFTAPAGATGAFAMRGPDLSAAGGATTSQVRIQSLSDFSTTLPAGGLSPNLSSGHAIGTLVTSSTGGTFAVRWSQNASDPTASVLMAHSWLKLTRMS